MRWGDKINHALIFFRCRYIRYILSSRLNLMRSRGSSTVPSLSLFVSMDGQRVGLGCARQDSSTRRAKHHKRSEGARTLFRRIRPGNLARLPGKEIQNGSARHKKQVILRTYVACVFCVNFVYGESGARVFVVSLEGFSPQDSTIGSLLE